MATKIERDIEKHSEAVLTGNMLAIDPSSGSAGSKAGYAWFEQGNLIQSGIIDINHKQHIAARLDELYAFLAYNYREPDILVIEKIRGKRAHEYLKWAVGVTVAAVKSPVLIEMSPTTWKKYTDGIEGYEKADEQDAIAIGISAIEIAKEIT